MTEKDNFTLTVLMAWLQEGQRLIFGSESGNYVVTEI